MPPVLTHTSPIHDNAQTLHRNSPKACQRQHAPRVTAVALVRADSAGSDGKIDCRGLISLRRPRWPRISRAIRPGEPGTRTDHFEPAVWYSSRVRNSPPLFSARRVASGPWRLGSAMAATPGRGARNPGPPSCGRPLGGACRRQRQAARLCGVAPLCGCVAGRPSYPQSGWSTSNTLRTCPGHAPARDGPSEIATRNAYDVCSAGDQGRKAACAAEPGSI